MFNGLIAVTQSPVPEHWREMKAQPATTNWSHYFLMHQLTR